MFVNSEHSYTCTYFFGFQNWKKRKSNGLEGKKSYQLYWYMEESKLTLIFSIHILQTILTDLNNTVQTNTNPFCIYLLGHQNVLPNQIFIKRRTQIEN